MRPDHIVVELLPDRRGFRSRGGPVSRVAHREVLPHSGLRAAHKKRSIATSNTVGVEVRF